MAPGGLESVVWGTPRGTPRPCAAQLGAHPHPALLWAAVGGQRPLRYPHGASSHTDPPKSVSHEEHPGTGSRAGPGGPRFCHRSTSAAALLGHPEAADLAQETPCLAKSPLKRPEPGGQGSWGSTDCPRCKQDPTASILPPGSSAEPAWSREPRPWYSLISSRDHTSTK